MIATGRACGFVSSCTACTGDCMCCQFGEESTDHTGGNIEIRGGAEVTSNVGYVVVPDDDELARRVLKEQARQAQLVQSCLEPRDLKPQHRGPPSHVPRNWLLKKHS